MAVTYAYKVNGSAEGGQTWETTGEVTTVKVGDFMHAVNLAMGESFGKLTQGKATFGNPGVGCSGPYRVTSFWIGEKF